MNARPLALGLLFASVLTGEEIPRAVQVAEPPQSMRVGDRDQVISHTQQFRVSGGDTSDRSVIAVIAEEAKDELLKLTGESDEWKVPVSIRLHGKPGDPIPPRTVAMKILVSEVGYELRLDYHLGAGRVQETLKHAITSALVDERSLRGRPTNESGTPFLAPPWLVDGLREANTWQQGQSDRRLYEALFKSGGLFKIDELFGLSEQALEELDSATRAAFRVSSGALVMALLEQPQGRQGFRAFLNDAAAFEGEMPGLLRRHFPELNLSETSLSKWWALQLANIGAKNPATDILTIERTETALGEALRLHVRNGEGLLEPKELATWPQLGALADRARIEAVQPAQEALVRLSYRCFPSYRPIIAEYQFVLRAVVENKTKDLTERIAALDERRATMIAKVKRGRDYLDWFEISRARDVSGAFDDYTRLKERLKAAPPRRTDDLSKYLDRMDAIFNRGQDPASPWTERSSQPAAMELPDLPPLPR